MTREQNDILNGPIWRALIGFFIPCWLGLLFQQCYSMVDTLIVGNFVGTNAVAAVGNVGIAVQLVLGVMVAIASGAGVVVSQHFGAGRDDQVREDVRCGMLLALAGGLLLTGVCAALSGPMVRLLKTPAQIEQDSTTYLRVYFYALTPNLLYNFGTALLRGLGDSKRPLYVLLLASVVNIVLDLVFVIGLRWGVFGVAVATDISQLVSAVLVVFMLAKRFPGFWRGGPGNPTVYRKVFAIGLPTAFQGSMYNISNVLIQMAINSFGTAAIAAWSIYGRVDCISWMTMSSMGMAVTSFAGQNFGARQLDRVKRCAWVSSAMVLGALVVLIAFFCSVARPLFGFFTHDAEVVDIGVSMMLTLTPAYLLYFLIELLPGVLRGCGDVLVPTIASLVGICLLRVIWLTCVVPVYHTLLMVMLSYTITWALTSAFYVVYFLRGKWLERCMAASNL